MRNRSVPTDVLLPHIAYENVAEALAWLTDTFGFQERYRYGNPATPAGAQMTFGQAVFMIESTRPGRTTPAQSGTWTQMLTVFVEDVEAQYQKVKAKGAPIAEDLNDTVYGERQFGVLDLAGHFWLFSQHVQDADPTSWGAQTK